MSPGGPQQCLQRLLFGPRPPPRPAVRDGDKRVSPDPNLTETNLAKEPGKRSRRKAVTVWEAEQVVVGQERPGDGSQRCGEGTAHRGVRLAVRNSQGERSSSVEKPPCAHCGRPRIGELLEAIPDRYGVESPSGDVIELPDGDAKSHAAGEGRRRFVHVEPLEHPPGIAGGSEERADVAADLEPGTASPMRLLETPHLRAIRPSLILVERSERRLVRQLGDVGLDQLGCALPRIAVDERASATTREAKRRVL